MNHPAIVVIAYDRRDSLLRLLDSLERAYYPENEVTLVISIDHSDKAGIFEDITALANSFEWTHGPKRVVANEQRLGLKKHVLRCSGLSREFGSIIVLEDDLVVSPAFYDYTVNALNHTENNEKIAGVSLYNHLLNVHVREPFRAIEDGYDNWYFQFASSWGQAYTRCQWECFEEWMSENDGTPFASPFIPANVSSWGENSWLKYYIRYMIETDKYFLYPRVSLTTNYSEVGTHKMGSPADLQVDLLYLSKGQKKEWHFSSVGDDTDDAKNNVLAVYDAFFENTRVLPEAIVDLYGYKAGTITEDELLATGKKTMLSSAALSFSISDSCARILRPLDANVVVKTQGSDFYFYDLTKKRTDRNEPSPDIKGGHIRKLLYNYRAFKAKYGLEIIKFRLRGK